MFYLFCSIQIYWIRKLFNYCKLITIQSPNFTLHVNLNVAFRQNNIFWINYRELNFFNKMNETTGEDNWLEFKEAIQMVSKIKVINKLNIPMFVQYYDYQAKWVTPESFTSLMAAYSILIICKFSLRSQANYITAPASIIGIYYNTATALHHIISNIKHRQLAINRKNVMNPMYEIEVLNFLSQFVLYC